MKYLIVLCVLSFVVLSLAETSLHPRGCIFALGKCIHECEEGTHGYYSMGCSQITQERSCDNLSPEPQIGMMCDYSACYCNPPTVRDPVTKTCVKVEDCPK